MILSTDAGKAFDKVQKLLMILKTYIHTHTHTPHTQRNPQSTRNRRGIFNLSNMVDKHNNINNYIKCK